MNTHRAVRQFLAKEENKTELKSERVELTVIGDIAKAVKTMESAEKSLDTIAAQAKKAEDKHEKALLKAYSNSLDDQNKLKDKLDKLDKVYPNSKKALDSAEKAAKNLGLSAKDIPEYTKLQNLISQYPNRRGTVGGDILRISEVTI